MQLAVDFLRQDLGLADHQFVAFAPHGLDQNRQLQLAASHDATGFGTARFLNSKGDIRQQLFFQTLAQIARCDVRAFAAGERRCVDRENHRDRRLIDLNVRQRLRRFRIRDGLADVYSLNPGNRENVAGLADGFIDALQAFE